MGVLAHNNEILSYEDETDADRKVSSRAFDRRQSRLHTIKSRYFMNDSIFPHSTKKRIVVGFLAHIIGSSGFLGPITNSVSHTYISEVKKTDAGIDVVVHKKDSLRKRETHKVQQDGESINHQFHGTLE